MHKAYKTELAYHTNGRTTPAPDPHQSTLRHMRHFCSAGLQPQCLVELQFQDRHCIDTRIVQQPIMPGFRSQVCRLVKLKFRDCLKHRYRSSQLLRNLHLQRRRARWGDCRATCWAILSKGVSAEARLPTFWQGSRQDPSPSDYFGTDGL